MRLRKIASSTVREYCPISLLPYSIWESCRMFSLRIKTDFEPVCTVGIKSIYSCDGHFQGRLLLPTVQLVKHCSVINALLRFTPHCWYFRGRHVHRACNFISLNLFSWMITPCIFVWQLPLNELPLKSLWSNVCHSIENITNCFQKMFFPNYKLKFCWYFTLL